MNMMNDCGHPVMSEESVLRCCDCEAAAAKKTEDAAWNAALEAAAVTAEGNARELRDGHPPFTTTHEVMDEAEAEALERFAVEIRALKRTT